MCRCFLTDPELEALPATADQVLIWDVDTINVAREPIIRILTYRVVGTDPPAMDRRHRGTDHRSLDAQYSWGWQNQFHGYGRINSPIKWARSGIPVDSDSHAAVFRGDQTDDLLTRAVTEALAAGMSWAQIAAQLGVPSPVARDHAAVTDHDWQEAIVAHENARVARLNDQTAPRQ